MQPQPANIAAAPTAEPKKDAKWSVDARHGPGRDVPIDTSTGTWMSLDVSPDGREIAFDLLGDLYTIPIGGGGSQGADQRPTRGDMQPRYSPDGREIAFTSESRRRGQYLGSSTGRTARRGRSPRKISAC